MSTELPTNPQNRNEQFLNAIADSSAELPANPQNRREKYLNAIAQKDASLAPAHAYNREEKYLEAIAKSDASLAPVSPQNRREKYLNAWAQGDTELAPAHPYNREELYLDYIINHLAPPVPTLAGRTFQLTKTYDMVQSFSAVVCKSNKVVCEIWASNAPSTIYHACCFMAQTRMDGSGNPYFVSSERRFLAIADDGNQNLWFYENEIGVEEKAYILEANPTITIIGDNKTTLAKQIKPDYYVYIKFISGDDCTNEDLIDWFENATNATEIN